jgi:hypothetical protein
MGKPQRELGPSNPTLKVRKEVLMSLFKVIIRIAMKVLIRFEKR